jgi:hypothetical protein
MTETMRMGHMMGPPFLKLSMKKFPVRAGPAGIAATAGLAAAAGAGVRLPLRVALTLVPGTAGATEEPGAPAAAGDVIGMPVPAGGAGFTAPVGGAGLAGTPAPDGGGGGGAAGWVWANAPRATMLRQRVSSVFIGAAMVQLRARLLGLIFIPKSLLLSPAKISLKFIGTLHYAEVDSLNGIE